ncbi:MAG: hypothetical protein ACFE9N_16830 [Promethearchaeota archaeon]
MFLKKFKDIPTNNLVYIITLVGLIIVLLVYIIIFIPIETSVPIYGIIDYEFAWTQDKVELIFLTWGFEGMTKQTIAIYWDFLFIFGYVSLSFGLILIVLRRLDGKIQTIGLYFTLISFLTGIFDIIENINLLIMLNAPMSISTFNPFIASLSALIKFCCLFGAVSYFLIALFFIIFNKVRKK